MQRRRARGPHPLDYRQERHVSRVSDVTMKRKRMLRILIYAVIAIVCLLFIGDFVFSRYVASKLKAFEASITRDEDGIQKGCREFTLGEGKNAVLLIHGINDSPRCYYKMAPALAKKGFTSRAMRLPGFGEPLPQYAKATKEQWLAAVDREVKALKQKHDRVAIAGHSLGGAIAIAYLLDHPDAVDAVVLIAPAVEVSNNRSPIIPVRGWHEFANSGFFFTRILYSPFQNDCHDPDEREYPGRMVFTPLNTAEQTFQLIDNNRGRADEIKLPLLMVLSKEDKVIDWRAAEKFYNDVSAKRKDIYFTKDAGHTIPFDYGWDDLTDEIAEFVGT